MPQVDAYELLVSKVFNFVAALTASMALLQALARERVRSEQRMLEAERAKSAFFANIGHEIRTPMNGVLGMTDALLQRTIGHEEREMVETIRASGGVMLALIDDVLDLSKLEAGRLQLHERPLSLGALTDELRGLWAPLAEKKQLVLRIELDAALPPHVLLDGLRLRQILGNLISNAIKFTEAGEVHVAFTRQAARLVCVVEDSGIGISLEQQQRLFTRFAQADDARARKYQGAGLGLALSLDLATHMQGTLSVDSTPGRGSRFTCALPLVETVTVPVVPGRPSRLPAGLRVLVVDDNAINRLVAQRLLGHSGVQVEVAVDGQGAIDAIAKSHFDLVLMDVHMPGLDGLEVTRQIRASGQTKLRIIGVSASAESADVQSCHDAGMNDFLAKPMTEERLVATLLRNV